MKRWSVLVLLVLLIGCEALDGQPRFFYRVEPLQPVLVLTHVEGLQPSLQNFLNRPFEVVDSLDGITLRDYHRVLVLYDETLYQAYPPILFGAPQLQRTQLNNFRHPSGVDMTVVYLASLEAYQELFAVVDQSIYQIRDPQVVYKFYPLHGIHVHVASKMLRSELLLERLPRVAALSPTTEDLRWLYTSQEIVFFLDETIPHYLSQYATQLQDLQEDAVVIVTERGQRWVIGRAVGPNASSYYETFLELVSRGTERLTTLSFSPPVTTGSLESRVAPIEVCYTKDLRDQLFDATPFQTTVSHQILPHRLSSVGHHVGLVVRIQFDWIEPRVSDQDYLNIIQQAHRFTDAYYQEMSEGQLSFEWMYYPRVVSAPFFLNASLNPGSPGYMTLVDQHVRDVLAQVEEDFDLSRVDFISFVWPLGLPEYVTGGLAEQRTERLNTIRGDIFNYVIQRLDTNPARMAHVVTHELAHNLGLTDLYLYPWVASHRNMPSKYGHWDLMAAPNELNAWHRWILSWMPDEQVQCLPMGTHQAYEVFLEPLNNPQASIRQIVVSLSETQAISIELRGDGRFCPSGCDQNILVTFIDTMVGDGQGPMEILRPARSTRRDHSDALLEEGEFVQFRNITITHQERTPEGSVVLIRFD